MCQLSSIHRDAVYGLLSGTSALLRSMPWTAMSACSAHAEADTSPFLRACQCSFSQCFWDLPVYPMYTFGHTVQEMELTTPRQRGAETKNHSDFVVHQQSMERYQTSPHTIRHPGGVSSTDDPSPTAGSLKDQVPMEERKALVWLG